MAEYTLKTRRPNAHTEELETRTFCVSDNAPQGFGYVWEYLPDGRRVQVCDGLYHRGSTLTARPETLASVIRRERRVQLRQERAEERAYDSY